MLRHTPALSALLLQTCVQSCAWQRLNYTVCAAVVADMWTVLWTAEAQRHWLLLMVQTCEQTVDLVTTADSPNAVVGCFVLHAYGPACASSEAALLHLLQMPQLRMHCRSLSSGHMLD